MPENKVSPWFKNVHYVPYNATDRVATFKTPIPMPGTAVELTNEPRAVIELNSTQIDMLIIQQIITKAMKGL